MTIKEYAGKMRFINRCTRPRKEVLSSYAYKDYTEEQKSSIRNVEKVLQQQVFYKNKNEVRVEWEDVPIVEEEYDKN